MEGSGSFQQEILGLISSAHKRAFESKYIERLFSQEPSEIDPNISYPHCFISVDPSGCGKQSDFAIVSFIRWRACNIIVGMEAFSGETGQQDISCLLRHVQELRCNYSLSDSRFVFILENNLESEADYLAAEIEDNLMNFVLLSNDDAVRKYGLRTTNAVKMSAVDNLRFLLVQDALAFANDRDFVTVYSSRETLLPELKDKWSFSQK